VFRKVGQHGGKIQRLVEARDLNDEFHSGVRVLYRRGGSVLPPEMPAIDGARGLKRASAPEDEKYRKREKGCTTAPSSLRLIP
jgi:hypothetical protein